MSAEKTTLVILGSTGMLGNACARHFFGHNNYNVFLSTRSKKFSSEHTIYVDAYDVTTLSNIPRCDYVINCIGLIKQDPSSTYDKMIAINSIFVNKLAEYCRAQSSRLIHISTDSVFSGRRGLYVESDIPSPVDQYGESKLRGEASTFMCIRTSTIGEELRGKFCILEWLRTQSLAGNQVDGYVNQFWNGITAKEYAKMCDRIVRKDLYVEGIRHVYSNVMTKYQLLHELNKKFNLGSQINPVFLDTKIDRTLISEYNTCRRLNIPTIEEMIQTL